MRQRFLIVPMLVWLSGCLPIPVTHEPPITHVVVCWLKQPGDPDGVRKLIAASKSFDSIPGLISVKTGPVHPSTRPAVDASFDVAVVMRFRDSRSLEAYSSHPKHLQAVQEVLKPLVAKYVVYDFTEQ